MSRGLHWTQEAWESHQKARHDDGHPGVADHTHRLPAAAPRRGFQAPGAFASPGKSRTDPLAAFHALGHLPAGTANRTEQAYADLLEARRLAGEILAWHFHPFHIRLANRAFYRVDYLVVAADRTLEIHEVKGGHITERGQLKIRLAAHALPYFRMIRVQRQPKRHGGGFTLTEFTP